ncbi:sensor histidine kinase [Nonomuraea sp. B10E15]|uniref:sensor histidine kinase n=1 Tax=Nonomuraea sp. B10E15 TaxID=3153560 RepID=UPI00325F4CA7
MGGFPMRFWKRSAPAPGTGTARSVFARLVGHRALIGYDVAVVVLFGLLGVVPEALTSRNAPPSAGFLMSVVLVSAAVAVPIAVRRVWPVPAFAAGLVVGTAIMLVPTSMAVGPFLVAMTLYTVALTPARRRAVTALLLAMAATGLGLGLRIAGMPPDPYTGSPGPYYAIGGTWLVLAAVWTIARGQHERRAQAIRTAHQLADRAVVEERLRIARDLHDIVAHSMSLIAVKAGTAGYLQRLRPDKADDTLRVIEAASRGALIEMRRMLHVMRSDTDSGTDDMSATLGPIPGIGGLSSLADQVAAADVLVDLDVHDVERLPDSVGLTVYRIVQEALTNVVRHAAPATCHVVISGRAPSVEIEITDDGRGAPRVSGVSGDGHGLIGMRERVATYGGVLTAGPRPQGGFAVRASIPYAPVDEAVREAMGAGRE